MFPVWNVIIAKRSLTSQSKIFLVCLDVSALLKIKGAKPEF